MKVEKTIYFYQVAEEHSYLKSIYGEFFITTSERVDDGDIILIKKETMTFDFPELSREEIIEKQIAQIQATRDKLRKEHVKVMEDYAERIRNLQLLAHDTSDGYISKEDNIE